MANPQALGGYSNSLELLTNGQYYQYLVGAQISIPIANADAKANYAQAKVNSEGARLSLEQLEEEITRQINESVNNLESFLKAIEARRIARELAEENVRNQQARYDVGLATTKDLIDFQDRLTQAAARRSRRVDRLQHRARPLPLCAGHLAARPQHRARTHRARAAAVVGAILIVAR